MNLYERVKEVAKSKNVSINQMEKDLGFARSYISKFKTIAPGIENLQKIANYLGVSVDNLLGKEVSKPIISDQLFIEFNSLFVEYPDITIYVSARLCKNQRIEKDLTEKYVAANTDVVLADYLDFENEYKNIGFNKTLRILQFLEFNIAFITGYITGFIAMAQPSDTDLSKLFDKLNISADVKDILLKASRKNTKELEQFMEENDLNDLDEKVDEQQKKLKKVLFKKTYPPLNAAHADGEPSEEDIKKTNEIMDNDENWD